MDNFEMFFPYQNYRIHQKETIERINGIIPNKKHSILKAPNGTGKSSIALTSILPLVYQQHKKLVYLCRTHQQNDRVIRELKKIKKKQPFVNGIAIRGRKNMCINEEFLKDKPSMKELMQLCQKAKMEEYGCKYFQPFTIETDEYNDFSQSEPLNQNLRKIIKEFSTQVVDTNDLIKMSKDKDICPYYVIKHLLSEMNIVVCNYLWIFQPEILNFSFLKDLNTTLNDIIIIIDECHNLPETVLNVNEEKLSINTIIHCKNLLDKYSERLSNLPHYLTFKAFVNSIFNYITGIEKRVQDEIKNKKERITTAESIDLDVSLNDFIRQSGIQNITEFRNLLSISRAFSITIHTTEQIEFGRRLRDWLMNFINFWEKWLKILENKELKEIYYAGYQVKELGANLNVYLHTKPFDPMKCIEPVIQNISASLSMSGTLNVSVYKDLTGLSHLDNNLDTIELKTPFEKKNRLAIIDLDVTSAQNYRKSEYYRMYNEKIEEILMSRQGNTGIFAVSYKLLAELKSRKLGKNSLEYIIKNKCRRPLFEEKRGVDSVQNTKMIKSFKKNTNAVLLGVLSGRNSEGEDFPGAQMETVIIVGLPFAPPSPFIDRQEEYFNQKFDYKGWEYAKLEPAIRKANQAAGRPIRSESDKGVIIFLDKRYRNYTSSLSEWLTERGVLKFSGIGHSEISDLIRNFN